MLSFIGLIYSIFKNNQTANQKIQNNILTFVLNMNKLNNIHSGEILNEEFLIPLKISTNMLSKDLEIPQTRISQIIKGKRRITADIALRLSSYFGNSAKFWLGLQDDFEIEEDNKVLI